MLCTQTHLSDPGVSLKVGALEQVREVEQDNTGRGSLASTATPNNSVVVKESGLSPQTIVWRRVNGRSSILLQKPALPQHLHCCWISSNNLEPVRQHSGNQQPLVTRRACEPSSPTCHIPSTIVVVPRLRQLGHTGNILKHPNSPWNIQTHPHPQNRLLCL